MTSVGNSHRRCFQFAVPIPRTLSFRTSRLSCLIFPQYLRMKALAAVFALAVPFLCLAENPPAGIETLREFDLQLVAAGDWNPIAIDWDASGRMWAAVTTGDPLHPRSPRDGNAILTFEGRSLGPQRLFCSGPGRL